MTHWLKNGVPADSIGLDDRAVQYGDGVFETVAIRDARPRYWDLHIARLAEGCRRLTLAMPAESILERDLERALAGTTVNTGFATAKIIVTAGGGPRGYSRPADPRSTTLIGVFPNRPLEQSLYSDGVAARHCTTPVAIQPRTAGIKTLNRLDQVLARAEWQDPEIFEGFMSDVDGRLVCGTMSNLFFVRGSRLVTPSLARAGVAGIMRRRIIDLLAENGIECDEEDVGASKLEDMDEVFICNSQFGVLPIRRCDDHLWPVGEATRSVMTMLGYDEVSECRA